MTHFALLALAAVVVVVSGASIAYPINGTAVHALASSACDNGQKSLVSPHQQQYLLAASCRQRATFLPLPLQI
jgi:hypothetical protein